MFLPELCIKRPVLATLFVCVGITFTTVAISLLYYGHLHEDAYILFQYSHNLSNGQGIVFDKTSGPTEGATDFLWMVLLAFFSLLGLNLGTAAAILNGIGLSVICYAVISIGGGNLFLIAAIGLIIFSGGVAASLGGFSSLAFGAIFSLLLLSTLKKRYGLMTFFALLLALFRPDGVLLAFGSLLLALVTALPEHRKRILLLASVAVVIGLGYFFWRFSYFGLWLPLPLMVKSKTSKLLEGLGYNYQALLRYTPLLIPFIYLIYKDKTSTLPWRELCVVTAGPAILFIALIFAHQSQNVGYRFQFPIVLSVIFSYIICLREIEKRKVKYSIKLFFILVLPLPGMLLGMRIIVNDFKYLSNRDYINSFPQYLRESGFKAGKVAITEAGRFPYWFNADKMIDLVGLNSSDVVLHGANETLSHERPDFIFVHHAGQYEMAELANNNDQFFLIDARKIKTAREYSGHNPVLIAPRVALQYATENDFSTVFVRYGSDDSAFHHVYFLSRRLDIDHFLRVLEKSIDKKINYYDSENLKKSFSS